jgi:hypothetical protein
MVFNPAWQESLDLMNQIAVAQVIVESALAREETRGAHARSDFPDSADDGSLRYIVARRDDAGVEGAREPAGSEPPEVPSSQAADGGGGVRLDADAPESGLRLAARPVEYTRRRPKGASR